MVRKKTGKASMSGCVISESKSTFYVTQATSPGCHSLSLDCLKIRDLFLENRFHQVSDPAQAAVIIIGTCVVIKRTEDESVDLVGKMRVHRDRGAVVIVSGCLTPKMKDRVRAACDCLFFPADNPDAIREYFGFSRVSDEERRVDTPIGSLHGTIRQWQILHRVLKGIWNVSERICPRSNGMLKRFLNITYPLSSRAYFLRCANGCSNFCTYCEICHVRGNIKSRPIEEILAEMRVALKAGYNHFVFVADDLSSHGLDRGQRLSDLLEAVWSLGDFFTIELPNLHPKHIFGDLDRFLRVLSSRVLCVDLALQSGSNRILKLMNRGYTRQEFLSVGAAILKKSPLTSLRTDVIVGFPSEDEDDLKDTIDVLAQLPFEEVGVPIFEEREGASATQLPGSIPRDVRMSRQRRVRIFWKRKQIRRWMDGFMGKNVIY